MKASEARRLELIKGSIADAIREKFERTTARVKALNDHLATCSECQAKEAPYRLCGTGNRLFSEVLEK